MKLPLSAPRVGLAAIALVAATTASSSSPSSSDDAPRPVSQAQSSDESPGDISGPCDEAEHADDPRCAGTGASLPTTPAPANPAPTPTPAPAGGDGVVHAGGGTVTYTVDNGQLMLVDAVANPGWSREVEQSAGREIEVDFRSGTRRVQVNIEIEDGQVRERVRARDDADDSEVRVENGVVTRQEAGDDHGGHGSDHRDDDMDDNSGSGGSGPG